ncbi:D-alanine--D-alanine ligase [Candidatus Hepatincola sp. Pdp]
MPDSPKKIVVLMGGVSAEREISLVTGDSVFKVLQTCYEVEKYILNEDITEFITFLKVFKEKIIVFNALHGTYGEDGRIPALLDLLKIPYTHSGVVTSAIAMNKVLSKQLAKSMGIPVANHKVVIPKKLKSTDIQYPCVLKPIAEGSSVGIYILHNAKDFNKVQQALQKFSTLMCEDYFQGIECTVGVLQGKALGVTDIIPKNEFYDFESKYAEGGSSHVLPSKMPQRVQTTMKKYAEDLYVALLARGTIRVDFIYNQEQDKFICLEINTHPGMTPSSLLPEQAEYTGISFLDLCKSLIQQATFDV